jgi:site-specific DNA recombinase
MKPIDGQKVAIYIRWSTDDQSDGTTLEVQLDGCRHYVLSQGWQVQDDLTFVDDGYSGGNLERPALTRLRSLIRAGGIDCVVVFKVDRLSRSVVDTVNLVLKEWDGRTFLKSAREPIDTTTAMGKQFFYMLVSYAEWERSVIRERTVSGRRRRAEQGYKPSAIAPYGYRHAPGRKGALEIVPAEAELVREIFRLSQTGLGAKAIASLLNERGSRGRQQRLWSDKTVQYMLQNRVYVGDMVYGKTARNPRYGKAPGETALVRAVPVVVTDSEFIPPLIDRTAFEAAQAFRLLRRRGPGKPSGRANSSPYLLTGIARCRCGYGLFGKEKSGGRCVYMCMGRRIKGARQCDAAPIPMHELDAEIERRVRARYSGLTAGPAFAERVAAGRTAERQAREAELGEVVRQLAELAEQRQKVRRDYRLDRIDADAYRDLIGEIAQERQALERRRHLLEAAASAEPAAQALPADPWGALTTGEKKQVLRSLVDRLTVYRSAKSHFVQTNLSFNDSG